MASSANAVGQCGWDVSSALWEDQDSRTLSRKGLSLSDRGLLLLIGRGGKVYLLGIDWLIVEFEETLPFSPVFPLVAMGSDSQNWHIPGNFASKDCVAREMRL
jgi:hypothetical protein